MAVEILPECRTRDRRGAVQSRDGWWVHIYCANCGRPQGFVPERFITCTFALCDRCCDRHGTPASMYVESDAAFRERVRAAMLDERIDRLTEIDMRQHVDDASSRIGKLLRERVALILKES